MDRQILFVFKVGHSVQKRVKPLFNRTHHWRCYVESWNPNYPLSVFVKKVTFKLHDTFENPRQVVRQAPFAIEEDGFGNFQLTIEVTFLDYVATFPYDLTLFDSNALHAYRTVRVQPCAQEWNRMIRLGGIVIPQSDHPADIHKVVRAIQSCSDLNTLHPHSFFSFPELEAEKDWSPTHSIDSDNPSTCQDRKGYSKNNRPSGSPTNTPASHDSHRSFDHLFGSKPLPQKHKKKLQLLHEAQLLEEDAQKQKRWASSSSSLSSAQVPTNSPPPMSSSPNWPSKKDQHSQRYSPDSSPTAVVPRLNDSHTQGSASPPSSNSIQPITSEDLSLSEPSRHSPVRRIVLKLSRTTSSEQLRIASLKREPPSSRLVPSDGSSEDRRERRRRKKELRRMKQLQAEEAARLIVNEPNDYSNLQARSPSRHEDRVAPTGDVMPSANSPSLYRKSDKLTSFRQNELPTDQAVSSTRNPNGPGSKHSPDNAVLLHRSSGAGLSLSDEEQFYAMDVGTPSSTSVTTTTTITSNTTTSPSNQLPTNHHSTVNLDEFAVDKTTSLLLNSDEDDFEDALYRPALFSQGCLESMNPAAESPSVDLFGDEQLSDSENEAVGQSPSISAVAEEHKSRDMTIDPPKLNLFNKSRRAVTAELSDDDDVNDDDDRTSTQSLSSTAEQQRSSGRVDESVHKHRKRMRTSTIEVASERKPPSRPIEPARKEKHKPSASDIHDPRYTSPSTPQPPMGSSSGTNSITCSPTPVQMKPTVVGASKQHKRSKSTRPNDIQSNSRPKSSHTPAQNSQAVVDTSTKQASSRHLNDRTERQKSRITKNTDKRTTDIRVPLPIRQHPEESCKQTSSSCQIQDELDLKPPQTTTTTCSIKSTNQTTSSAKRFVADNVELSSLSSPSSEASLPTPPMSDPNSDLVIGQPTVPTETQSKSTDPDKNLALKQVETQSIPPKTKQPVSNTSRPLSKALNTLTAPITTASVRTNTVNAEPRETCRYTNEQLESLFDRLCCLKQPHLAIRMGEILMNNLRSSSAKQQQQQSTSSSTDTAIGPPAPPPSSSAMSTNGLTTKSGRAVKVLSDREPHVIAFNLRKLPFACLDQLTALIEEDESSRNPMSTGGGD